MSTGKMYHSIAALLSVAVDERGLPWLKEALQWAVELEIATLPPYLCARWSIGGPDETSTTERIKEIARDEMNHLGAAANMLVAIGGAPRMIGPAVPVYPGRLPGGVHPELNVTLGALTNAQLDLFMKLEEPETPIPTGVLEADTYPTIGRFYAAIAARFERVDPVISMRGQVSHAPSFPDLKAVLAGIENIYRFQHHVLAAALLAPRGVAARQS